MRWTTRLDLPLIVNVKRVTPTLSDAIRSDRSSSESFKKFEDVVPNIAPTVSAVATEGETTEPDLETGLQMMKQLKMKEFITWKRTVYDREH